MKVCTHSGTINTHDFYIIHDKSTKCPYCNLEEVLEAFKEEKRELVEKIKKLIIENQNYRKNIK